MAKEIPDTDGVPVAGTAPVPFLRKLTPYDTDGRPGELRLVLGNGQSVVLHESDISEPNRVRAMWHGLSQRLGDSVSGCGKDKAYDHAFGVLSDLKATLGTSDWSSAPRKPGESTQAIEDLATAIATLKSQPLEAVRPLVAAATPEKRAEWRKHPQIATAIAEIVLAKAKSALANGTGDAFFFEVVELNEKEALEAAQAVRRGGKTA